MYAKLLASGRGGMYNVYCLIDLCLSVTNQRHSGGHGL
jgi:hypothetical protein